MLRPMVLCCRYRNRAVSLAEGSYRCKTSVEEQGRIPSSISQPLGWELLEILGSNWRASPKNAESVDLLSIFQDCQNPPKLSHADSSYVKNVHVAFSYKQVDKSWHTYMNVHPTPPSPHLDPCGNINTLCWTGWTTVCRKKVQGCFSHKRSRDAAFWAD